MTEPIRLFTIGFTQKSAKTFFSLLADNGVKTVLDTRLNNTGQLAGFSKKDDLAYFAEHLAGAKYVHWQEAAPTEEMLAAYKKKSISWDEYASEYKALIASREVEKKLSAGVLQSGCLLCSEAKPHHCHRRLLAEYLKESLFASIEVVHL